MKTSSSNCRLPILFVAVWLMVLGVPLRGAETPTVEARVDKTTVTIGDIVTYSVKVRRDPDVQVDIPTAANLGGFEIRDYHIHEPESVDGQVVERIDYKISTFEVGTFEIPPLEVFYTLPDDTARQVLRTSRLDIVVESMNPSDSGDIRDIKPPWSIPRDWRPYLLWGAIALLLVAGVLTIVLWRRRKAGKRLIPRKVIPPRPAHEVALEALQALRESSLLKERRIKEFYTAASEIIRRYIENRYFIPALEMTSVEVVAALQTRERPAEHVDDIRAFFEICDLVKFAKIQPPESEHHATLERAIDIVKRTRLVYDQPQVTAEEASETELETSGAPDADRDNSGGGA